MKKILYLIGTFLFLFILYLLLWPIALTPESWQSPDNPQYTGAYAANTLLQAVEVKHPSCPACEDVAGIEALEVWNEKDQRILPAPADAHEGEW